MKACARGIGFVFIAVLAGCVSVPPGPPPEIVRLERELSRLHADPHIATYGGVELRNADAAMELLSRESRSLDDEQFRHGVYLTDRLILIAEASGLARYEEQRGRDLSAEREHLLARSVAAPTAVVPRALPRTADGQSAHDRLALIQSRLSGLESHLDARGLVVTLGDFMFETGRGEPREATMRALDTLVSAVRAQPAVSVSVGAQTNSGGQVLDERRAATVRTYLATRGVDPLQLDTRYPVASSARNVANRPVEIVVRAER